jgi:hypothetical protein
MRSRLCCFRRGDRWNERGELFEHLLQSIRHPVSGLYCALLGDLFRVGLVRCRQIERA